ncbi:MAG: ribonuclease Z [Nitrospirae bacterium]|nr:MAG: ribonuclease Z [Nitrospirota bacterium]
MRTSLLHRPLNGPFEDPMVYIKLLRERRALLFDAGETGALTPRQINIISHLFITHTHIDHFIGFDRILRVVLRREKPLIIYGGPGITEKVEGKLRGYTWNLIEEYPVSLIVHELDGEEHRVSEFNAKRGFEKYEIKTTRAEEVILREPDFTVKVALFDHGIPVLGFSIEEERHLNINKVKLAERGLSIGSWLSQLKDAYRRNDNSWTIKVDKKLYSLNDLKDLVVESPGKKITYITDISPTKENIERAVSLSSEADTLYIEAYFLEQDLERAVERNHLTAGIAGRIGREAGVRELIPLHTSPKYLSNPESVINEVMENFRH